MKYLNKAKKFGKQAAASTVLLASTASLALADEAAVLAEIDTGKATGIAIASAILGVIVGIAIYKHIRRGA